MGQNTTDTFQSPDTTMSEKFSESAPELKLPASIHTRVFGIWKVLMLKESFSLKPSAWFEYNKYIATLPHVYRLAMDVYTLNPTLVIVYLVARAWKGIEPGIAVYISSQLYIALESYLRDGQGSNPKAVLQAIVAHIFFVILSTLTTKLQNLFVPKLTAQTEIYFEEHLMRENLRYDVQTLHQSKTRWPDACMAWFCFSEICEAGSNVLGLFTIVTSVLYQDHGGSFFTILCLIYPSMARALNAPFRKQPLVVFSENKDYIRIQALEQVSAKRYREDIVINNLAEYIMNEYVAARKGLGTSYIEDPFDAIGTDKKALFQIFRALSGEIPVMYFAYCALLDPASHMMSTLAILRQQSNAMSSSVSTIFQMFSSILYTLDTTKRLYHMEELRLIDGETEYCPPEGNRGMSFDLHNVSFTYPSAKSKEGALKDISLRIEAGQLVVIVGANGSGKSTLIKLLTRVYDVTSGDLLVDGLPVQDYKVADLHDATAILNQDHKIYPFSLAENIGLGYSACIADVDMIKDSVEKGGASEVIAGMKAGLETILEPIQTAQGYNLESKHQVLREILQELEMPNEVSGGEKQRIVASRTFMRLHSPKVKFVAVDEPSSALDPRGELQLFDRLRSEQAGRTMIFVTHRFGHLTKHADLVICMKNGEIIEQGAHKDLLALDGEYATLYNIQAQAFAPVEVGSGTPPTADIVVD
ncbi:P-loop containing nucleoside triphosphate hydrolase protein [Lyophyllum atratum]|nr:P-loop containing nucleoside triphosphate hydrolase protein [Lyophyllum atratum]